MAISMTLTGEGIAAILAIGVTGISSVYTTYRQIRADSKADARDARNEAQKLEDDKAMRAQNAALALVAENQTKTHDDLKTVVSVVAGVQDNVAKVEKATNSLKDALVDTTKLAWQLKGQSEGIAAEKARSGTTDTTQPDGAPTATQLNEANQAQAKAVANDAQMRVVEKDAIKDNKP